MAARELDEICAQIAESGSIAPQDVLRLRAAVYDDGIANGAEADCLFALDASIIGTKCPEWAEFFCEAVTDYIVHRETPAGYISAQNADWLIAETAHDGVIDSATELEMLVRVLEAAKSAPDTLSAFALAQVKHAVVEGRGPLASGRTLQPGVVGKAEVELLRRILHAFGGDGNVGISRAEAEVLFDINDRTAEAGNDPAWTDLFVKALANFLLCTSGYTPPSRQEALRRDDFFEKADPDLAGFFGRMMSGGMKAVVEAYVWPQTVEDAFGRANRKKAGQAAKAEAVDAGEARWLAERIGRDKTFHDNEKALLAFIKRESPNIHPDLKPLLDRVA